MPSALKANGGLPSAAFPLNLVSNDARPKQGTGQHSAKKLLELKPKRLMERVDEIYHQLEEKEERLKEKKAPSQTSRCSRANFVAGSSNPALACAPALLLG